MQIVCTFNDFEEIEVFARRVLEQKAPLTAKELNESAKKTAEIINAAEAKEEAEKQAKKEKVEKSTPKTEKPAEEAPAQSDEPAEKSEDISESDLKILLSKKLKAGKKAKVKELFEEYGVDSLSGLIDKHPDKIAEAYHKAEGI
jgi:sRNA-binding protein